LAAELAAKRADSKLAVTIESDYPPAEVQAAFAPSSSADQDAGEEAAAYSFQSAFAWRSKNGFKHPDVHAVQTLPGEKLQVQRQARSGGDGLDYVADARKMICSNAGVQYYLAAQDFAGMTYSTSQLGEGFSDRSETQNCSKFGSQFLTPILIAVQEEMFAVGALKPARRVLDYYKNRAAYAAGDWYGPGRVTGDQVKTGLGHEYALNSGITSPDMIMIKNGQSPRKVIAARARYNRLLERNNLPQYTPMKMLGKSNENDDGADETKKPDANQGEDE
jgi:capsid protein